MLGLFIASVGLATAVAFTTFLTAGPAQGCAFRAAQTLRFWTFYLALFGLIGLPLTLLGLAAPIPLAVSLGTAAVFSRLLGGFFHEASADVGLTHLVGTEARVLLPVDGRAGKVVVETQAARVELPARSSDGQRLERGSRVFVSLVEDGVAAVTSLESPVPARVGRAEAPFPAAPWPPAGSTGPGAGAPAAAAR